VTRRALQLGMSSHESKPGDLLVVKLCAYPGVKPVARIAREWKFSCGVVHRFRCLIIWKVARGTIGAQAGELGHPFTLVAGLAINR
jgi:hypothetical protein